MQKQLDFTGQIDAGKIEIIEVPNDCIIRYKARDNPGKLVKNDNEAMFIEEYPNQIDRKILEEKEDKKVKYIGSSAYVCAEVYRNEGSKLKEFTVKCHGFTPYAAERKEFVNWIGYYDKQFGMIEHRERFKEAIQVALDWLNCKHKEEKDELP